MTDTITLTGIVATIPRQTTTSTHLVVTSFRLASTQRRFDRAQNKWIDGDTNWYSVAAFRQLAENAFASINKGDKVVVTGRLRIREWSNAQKSGTNVEVEADALGHDLSWGTSRWARTVANPSAAMETISQISSDTGSRDGWAVPGLDPRPEAPTDDGHSDDTPAPDLDESEPVDTREGELATPF